jgi:hypothetical protein
MKVISHRGNLTGPNKATENDPRQIEHVLKTTDFDAEIDLRRIGEQLFLGHDEPQYKIDASWLYKHCDRLWVHAKSLAALEWLNSESEECLNFFWHQDDSYTLTSHGYIWVYPNRAYTKNSVLVHLGPDFQNRENVLAICTDYPLTYENKNA